MNQEISKSIQGENDLEDVQLRGYATVCLLLSLFEIAFHDLHCLLSILV